MVKKEKRTTLQLWQKPISKEEYIKAVEQGLFGYGYFKQTNQYYVSDMKHPEYLKHIAKKLEVKKAKKALVGKRVDNRIAHAVKKAKIVAVKEFKKSDKFAKIIKSAVKKEMKALKPQMTAQDRLLKAQARMAKEQAKINKLTKLATPKA